MEKNLGRLDFYCDNRRHLVCVPYSVDNLHTMAQQLNIKRCWFHNGEFPHYDIPFRRQAEIMKKCYVVSPKDIVKIAKGESTINPS